jgi:putative FmdB family regulatory protein
MPIYQYQCTECGHELEALQKFSDAPLTDCPSCGKPTLKKQLTAAAFHLKGTGWYATDFRDKGKKPDAEKKETSAASDKASTPAADKTAPAASSSTAGPEK